MKERSRSAETGPIESIALRAIQVSNCVPSTQKFDVGAGNGRTLGTEPLLDCFRLFKVAPGKLKSVATSTNWPRLWPDRVTRIAELTSAL